MNMLKKKYVSQGPNTIFTYMLLTSVREPREILCEIVEINLMIAGTDGMAPFDEG